MSTDWHASTDGHASTDWRATRSEGLRRLAAFVPSAGRAYAGQRNYDLGPDDRSNVSVLSPYLRYRLITEDEVVAAVLSAHSLGAAEKFIQEVCWRTYWKGWLEQRPDVWTHYLAELRLAKDQFRDDAALAADVAMAEAGRTGLAYFDAWARELVEVGYLHNHTRMWFASIWIFTLRLPWVLGADFFYRHLLDADPASNTLSWRWVAGLHTQGKTYLARADNIAQFTKGRYQPEPSQLAATAQALSEPQAPRRIPLRQPDVLRRGARVVLVVTLDDLAAETWDISGVEVVGIACLDVAEGANASSDRVRTFKAAAMGDARIRAEATWHVPVAQISTAGELLAFAGACRASEAITAHVPIGPAKTSIDTLAGAAAEQGLPLRQIQRPWDRLFWPYAKAGFFQLKDRIPAVLEVLQSNAQGRRP